MSNIMSKEEILAHVQKTIGDYGGENQYSETQCMEAMELYASQQPQTSGLRKLTEPASDGWFYDPLQLQELTAKVNEQEHGSGVDMEAVEAVLLALSDSPSPSPAQEWIAVEDRLPEKETIYIVFYKGRIEQIWYTKTHGWHIISDQSSVTHWQPLPQAPIPNQ